MPAPGDELTVPEPPAEFMQQVERTVQALDNMPEIAQRFVDLTVPLGTWLMQHATTNPTMAAFAAKRIAANRDKMVDSILKSRTEFFKNVLVPLHVFFTKFDLCEKIKLCPVCSNHRSVGSSSGPACAEKPR